MVAIAERDAPELTVIDDWLSFGQRTTLSGTVLLDRVKVPKSHLVPAYKGYEVPTADGAIFRIIQVTFDPGIGQAASDETVSFVRTKTRAWVDSVVDNALDDRYTIQAIGSLTLRLHATQALLVKADSAIDRAVADPTAETFAEARSPSSLPTSCSSLLVRDPRSLNTGYSGKKLPIVDRKTGEIREVEIFVACSVRRVSPLPRQPGRRPSRTGLVHTCACCFLQRCTAPDSSQQSEVWRQQAELLRS